MIINNTNSITTIALDYNFFKEHYKNYLTIEDLSFLNILSDYNQNISDLIYIEDHISNIFYFYENYSKYPFLNFLDSDLENSIYQFVYYLNSENIDNIKNKKIAEFSKIILPLIENKKQEEIETEIKNFYYSSLELLQ
jgi:hypothetical protein